MKPEELAEAILKLPVGSSVTSIEDCIREENWWRNHGKFPEDRDHQINYVKTEIIRLLNSCAATKAP